MYCRQSRARLVRTASALAVMACAAAMPFRVAGEPPKGGPTRAVWSPLPIAEIRYERPNQVLTRLSDIVAQHAGSDDWVHPVVRTDHFSGDYVSLGQGKATKATFFGEERVIIWIARGSVDVEIEGQPRARASAGFLIDVAPTLVYRLTNSGSEPAIYFRVTPARQLPSYPSHEEPEPVVGAKYVKVKMSPYGTYEPPNQPVLDFPSVVIAQDGPSRDFAMDGHTSAHIIREAGIPTPPDSVLGHFHAGIPEIWLVLEGKIDAKISGEALVTGQTGDVILAQKGRWHRATSAGPGKSTRLAIMPRYKEGLSVMQQLEPGVPVEVFSKRSVSAAAEPGTQEATRP